MPIIESIPNVSEGRRPEVIEELAGAIRGTPGVRLLDHSSDTSHNRSVFTLVGDAPSLKAAILSLMDVAVRRIDLGFPIGTRWVIEMMNGGTPAVNSIYNVLVMP